MGFCPDSWVNNSWWPWLYLTSNLFFVQKKSVSHSKYSLLGYYRMVVPIILFLYLCCLLFAIYSRRSKLLTGFDCEITFVFQVQNSERIFSSPWCAIACLRWFIALDYFVPGYVAACSSSFLKAVRFELFPTLQCFCCSRMFVSIFH
jgi:hypothetical protein